MTLRNTITLYADHYACLYELVGRAIIERLRSLGVYRSNPGSGGVRCPASIFCSLPLHTMVPIPPDDMHKSSNLSKRYFSDLHTPSYTPSPFASLSRATRIRKRSINPHCFLLPNHMSLSRVCRETFRLWMNSTSRLRVLSQRGDDRRQNGR